MQQHSMSGACSVLSLATAAQGRQQAPSPYLEYMRLPYPPQVNFLVLATSRKHACSVSANAQAVHCASVRDKLICSRKQGCLTIAPACRMFLLQAHQHLSYLACMIASPLLWSVLTAFDDRRAALSHSPTSASLQKRVFTGYNGQQLAFAGTEAGTAGPVVNRCCCSKAAA
jgi:hypothetical protein